MSRTILANCRILTGSESLEDHVVIVDGSSITDVIPESQLPKSDQREDLDGCVLAPGLIDLQVNGGGGVLFNDDPTATAIRRIHDAHRRFGTTGFLPTLISDQPAVMQQAINAVDESILESPGAALGIHLEGPFLNRLQKGVHKANLIRPLDDDAVRLVASLTHGKTLLTLAPELASPGLISKLVAAGVVVSAGHSDASYDEIQRALDAGLTGFTHLFNAMSPLRGREPGVVGAALDDAHSWCGVIADGVHVHWAALRLALAAKPQGKVFLVTDAMPPVGTSEQTFELFGQTISRESDRLTTDSGRLAGSNLDMMTSVRNVVQNLRILPEEALRMASLYPAAFLGVDRLYGKIEKGFRANMILIDDQLQLRKTWIHGQTRSAS